MDDRDRLAFYPFVVVRTAAGSARAMGLTDWRGWQPNSGRRSARATSSIGFPTTACGARRRVASAAFQRAASTCRTSSSLGRPTRRPGSCGCASWSAMIDGRPRIELKGCPPCVTCTPKTIGQAAIRALFRIAHDRTGNLPAFPGIFPDQLAPMVRNSADGER
jgi:hypothetical protein